VAAGGVVFCVFAELIPGGESAVLQGVIAISWCNSLVSRGEFVVVCVVSVVLWWSLIRSGKIRHGFDIYFARPEAMEEWVEVVTRL
jgi:hypothetical protein